MNSDHATCGGSTWSTQTVNDSMYACGVGRVLKLVRDEGDDRVARYLAREPPAR